MNKQLTICRCETRVTVDDVIDDKRKRSLAIAAHGGAFQAVLSIDGIMVYAARGSASAGPGQAVSSRDTATVLAAIAGRYCPASAANFPAAA